MLRRSLSLLHPRGRAFSQRRSSTPSFDQEIAQLASQPLHPLTLTDLVRFGHPPLPPAHLLQSAAFTLRVLPIRLARRVLSLRNLPYIVVSNPHISNIYNQYLHSLRLLLSFPKSDFPNSLKEESRFNDVLDEVVQTHSNTIPTLARGFLECKRYVSPEETTKFLDEHLRARIGTRLLAEQHLALHAASATRSSLSDPPQPVRTSTYNGTIDTRLNPSKIIASAAEFVGDICDLRYGVRPTVKIDGMTDATFAYVPVHLEYIMTELLKNAFRATVENGTADEPIQVTVAVSETIDDFSIDTGGVGAGSAPQMSGTYDETTQRMTVVRPGTKSQGDGDRYYENSSSGIVSNNSNKISPGNSHDAEGLSATTEAARAVTIRIRDHGGGISPEHLPNIFSYSFTTFNPQTSFAGSSTSSVYADDLMDTGMDAISSMLSQIESSTIAGLGFGMGLSRAYAQFFGGDLRVESLWGWGTDVYVGLRGLSVDVE